MRARTRQALLLAGAVSSALYVVGIDVIAALLHPDYHDYVSQMVSELLAAGAPTRPPLVGLRSTPRLGQLILSAYSRRGFVNLSSRRTDEDT